MLIAFDDGTVARFDGDAADEELGDEGGISIAPLDPVDDLFIDEDNYHLRLGEGFGEGLGVDTLESPARSVNPLDVRLRGSRCHHSRMAAHSWHLTCDSHFLASQANRRIDVSAASDVPATDAGCICSPQYRCWSCGSLVLR